MDSGIECSLIAGLLHALVHELLGLAKHLFDAGRMDTAICDEVFHGHATDFATNRIEAGDGDAFRRVIDDEVGAG